MSSPDALALVQAAFAGAGPFLAVVLAVAVAIRLVREAVGLMR